jgi:hypothetical protein
MPVRLSLSINRHMSYEMHRVFVATPLELEDERLAMHEIIAGFNQDVAMPRNVLFVTVSLPQNLVDKRVYQAAVLDNIRNARFYLQFLEDSWGPPTRNFERDFVMAQKYAAAGSHACRHTALLFKRPVLPHRVDPDILGLKQSLGDSLVEFDGSATLKALVQPLFWKWLLELVPAAAQATESIKA